MRKATQTAPLTLRLPAPLLALLDNAARSEGRSRSFIVRRAIREYLRTNGAGSRRSRVIQSP